LIVAAIPAFDEEATIARVVIGSGRHVDKVLVCDDGSSDMTGVIAERLGNRMFMATGSTRQLNLCCGMIPNNGCMVFLSFDPAMWKSL